MPRREDRKRRSFGVKKRTKPRGWVAAKRQSSVQNTEDVPLEVPAEEINVSSASADLHSPISMPSTSSACIGERHPATLWEHNDGTDQPALHRKISYFQDSDEMPFSNGYRIISIGAMESFIQCFACPKCGQQKLQLQESRKGMTIFLQAFCLVCNDIISKMRSSEYNEQNKTSEINLISVAAAKNNGIGFSKMTNFICSLNVPKPMHLKTYQVISKRIDEAVGRALEKHLNEVANIIKTEYSMYDTSPSDNILNIAVSFDGSWHKRGHSSLFGVGAIIDLLTGLVIDVAVISKYCHGCSLANSDPEKFENHNCQMNFQGSSGAMEVEAALMLFGRSVEKYGLRYLTMLSDGDCKSYLKLKESNVYGEGYEITKEECINHVAKRMGTALRKLKATCKLKGTSIGGKGRLTDEKIEKMQNYYGKAVKDNAPDVTKMKNAVFASLFHMVSTDQEPHHKFCPPGITSWCHYNRALEDPALKRPHTPTLPKDIGELVLPIYKRLTDVELLERCKRNKTQNTNESLHSLIWQKCPKTTFASYNTVKTAAALAVLQFNKGPKGFLDIFPQLNVQTGKHQHQILNESLKRKMKDVSRFSGDSFKEKRRTNKVKRLRTEDRYEAKEGKMYERGSF